MPLGELTTGLGPSKTLQEFSKVLFLRELSATSASNVKPWNG